MVKLGGALKAIRWFVLALLLVGLVSCAPKVGSSEVATQGANGTWIYSHGIRLYSIARVVDEEAGVVCWIYTTDGTGGAIDCMPLAETRLDY
jgi:hypothetical protein